MAKKTASKDTLVLLDAHAILHRAYHALPDFNSPTGEPTGALYGVVAMLLKIIEEFNPTYIAACFDLPEPTYRHDAFTDYKAGRAKTDDALVQQINRSRDIFAAFGIPIYECSGFEADDLLGTIAEQVKSELNLQVVIASGDMDTMQLIDKKRVQVYTLKKGIKDTIVYDEAAVKERFGFGPQLIPDYKGLRGDPSDNIPGIAGIGEKTATELIVNFGSLETLYKKLNKSEQPFLNAGIKPRIIGLLKEHQEEAEFSKMLATIRLDVPVTYVRPSETWRDKLDLEMVLQLFAELGFRTLGTRVNVLFGEPGRAAETLSDEGERIPEVEVARAAIALWLLESDTTNPTYEDLLSYGRAHQITGGFAAITAHLTKQLKDQDLWTLYETVELPLMQVITTMQQNGITLDVVYLKTLSQKFHQELATLETTIYSQAGVKFNINSPKQMGDILYDTLGLKPKNAKKTAGGQRSTRESELEKLRDEHPIIGELLRYRELQKLVSTYVDTLPTMLGDDGRIHTTFLQAGTVTGRMASKDPNLQNIPARSAEGRAIRRGFIAPAGSKLVAIDYSQIELRIAAILSGDPKLMEIFKRGEDVHRGVAAQVFVVDADEVTDNMRRKAKVINFGILYGMGVNALRANLGEDTSRQEAQEFLNAYFNTFTQLAEYLEATKAEAKLNGYTTTFFNRRRHFPGITSGAPFIRASAERMAINAPIQGTQSDIIRIAMVQIHNYLQNQQLTSEVKMLLQVHDELVFEIADDKLASVIPTLVDVMTSVLDTKQTKGVPILADVKVGQDWEQLAPWKA